MTFIKKNNFSPCLNFSRINLI